MLSMKRVITKNAHIQGDHPFSTMIFHDQKMNFHDLLAEHIFFEINDTRFMNAYQNKNISSFQLQMG